MKRFTRFFLAAGLSAFFGSLVLAAQGQKVVADIPFAFETSGKVLPAGEYLVEETNTSGIFQLHDADGHSLFVTAHLDKEGPSGNPKLAFLCAGNDRILSQIWTDDGNSYLIKSSEKAMKRHLEMATLIFVKLTPR